MSEAKDAVMLEDESDHEGDDTEELYQSVFIKTEEDVSHCQVATFSSIEIWLFPEFRKIKSWWLSRLKIYSQIYAVSFHFNSAVKTERNDHNELIKILSLPEASPEKKRWGQVH